MKNLSISKTIIALALFLVAMLTFGGGTVFADSFALPIPFEVFSEDGAAVFKWNPGPEYEEGQAEVYRNGELIYSVENLPITCYTSNFFFSADLSCFVFIPTASQVMALGFFENGVLLRSYRIDELVRNMNVVKYSVSMAKWDDWMNRSLDTTNNTLTIITYDHITYVFDITTGDIIFDTAWDKPFVPHAEGSIGFSINELYKENPIPLWAQPSSWAQESIERAGELGLLPDLFRSGFGRNTTRAEFSAIAIALYEHIREPVTGRNTFTDTTDTNVEKAAYLRIVSGVGNNRFDPDSPLTREQAAVMLSNLANALGQPFPQQAPSFADNKGISSWAVNSVGQLQAAGIIGGVGDNKFAPQQPYTREQSIVTIIRLYEIME